MSSETLDQIGLARQFPWSPDLPAVRYAADEPALQTLSYSQLSSIVEATQQALAEAGVGRHSYVGVALGRSVGLVVVALALWRIGAVYIPLGSIDESSSTTALQQALASVPYLACVVVDDAGQPKAAAASQPSSITRLPRVHGSHPAVVLCKAGFDHEPAYAHHDLAYIIRTSGTTRPDGCGLLVRVPRSSIATNVAEIRDRLDVPTAGSAVFVLASAPTFDPSLIEMLLPLSTGNALLVVQEPVIKTPQRLFASLVQANVTHLMTTPSLLMRFDESHRRSLLTGATGVRHLVLGGEPFPTALLDMAGCDGSAGTGRIEAWNIYGTTECSVWASLTRVDPSIRDKPASIHHMLAHTEMRIVVDADSGSAAWLGSEANATTEGELWIGGSQRVCFIGDETEPVLMRGTGDLVRHDPVSGHLTYIGRRDRQIKRSGYRIHLDGVARILQQTPGVERCEVVWIRDATNKADALGRLAAFIKPRASLSSCDEKDLVVRARTHGQENMPFYAQPDWIELLNVYPVTRHGKIDYAKLAEMAASSMEQTTAKQNGEPAVLEGFVWSLLRKHLKLPLQQGSHSDRAASFFLAQGGTSLDAAMIVSQIVSHSAPHATETMQAE
ncbi:hypothetical protein BC831DRAFT_400028 [Entophlyctis helioformis]|nr:hypothetical protein BC831DRAFT_400028 [Entophlyctis helioformis]